MRIFIMLVTLYVLNELGLYPDNIMIQAILLFACCIACVQEVKELTK